MDINWKAILEQIKRIIDVLVMRFFRVKKWVDEYTTTTAAAEEEE
jgi:hypothetical protein